MCFAMGWPGLAQPQSVAAASAARQEAKPDLASVKRKIAADDRRRPMASIELARQTHAAGIHVLAERLRAGVAGHDFRLDDGQLLRKTCSIGYACHPLQRQAGSEAPADWNDTLALADQCLYVAKASGRDCWVGITTPTAGPSAGPADIRELRAGVEAGLWIVHHREGRELVWPAA